MFANVFTKTLRDQRRGLIGWSIGIFSLVGLMIAMWPSVHGMGDIEQFLASYPEVFKKMFDLSAYASGAGYLNAELFSLMLPAAFVAYGVSRGAKLLAGDEQAGTLEVVLTTPVARVRVLLDKAAALVVSLLVLGAVLFATCWVGALLVDIDVAVGQLLAGTVAVVLLGLEFGLVALAVGAATGRASVALAVGAIAAAAAYVLEILGKVVESVEPWSVLSPFHQALAGGPVGGGFPVALVWLVAVAAVALAAAAPAFRTRDVFCR